MRKRSAPARWRAPDGIHNAGAIVSLYPFLFDAVAELDALGHRIQARVANRLITSSIDVLIGTVLLRRAITVFVGVRTLFESSCVDPAKILIRAQFETLLAVRYLLYGGRRVIHDEPSPPRARESRARYYLLASKRRDLYKWQESLSHRDEGSPGGRVARGNRRSAIQGERLRLEKEFPVQWANYGEMRSMMPTGRPVKYFDHHPWFAFGFRSRGVNSISELASRLGYRWEYSVLYDSFSALSHSRGISQEVTIEHNQLLVHSPYNPSWLPLLGRWSCGWQTLMLTWLIKAYSPDSIHDMRDVHRRVEPLIQRLPETLPPGF